METDGNSAAAAAVTITSEHLAREIAATERALAQQQQQQAKNKAQEEEQPPGDTAPRPREPARTRLQRLKGETADLALAQRAAVYVRQYNHNNKDGDDWHRLDALGDVLLVPPNDSNSGGGPSSLYQRLYAQEFVPLCDFLQADQITTLRRILQRSHYPKDCEELLRQCDEEGNNEMASCCDTLQKVAHKRRQVTAFVEGSGAAISNNKAEAMDPALVEFCRPIAERIRYIFVVKTDDKDHRPTATRIDRLPEWLLSYLREHVFQNGGPWELVYYGLSSTSNTSTMAIDFLNEILRMVQWVLGVRNFFRDPLIVGPRSKPALLCQAVEQLLQFDAFVKSLIPASQANRVLSLVDVCVAGDEDLLHWWLARERESVFSTLLEETPSSSTSYSETDDAIINGKVSAKAELFGALIRSVRTKAAVFSFSGPYLSQVATPLCERFVDGVHATAVNLKRLLTQRQLPSDESLTSNVLCWMELINGTRMAATLLMEDDQGGTGNDGGESTTASPSAAAVANHDMARFGRSLERLHGVLIDEFVTNVVEILLMERAKFAGYLMRCSHMLSSGEAEVEAVLTLTDISPDLHETYRILDLILDICAEHGGMENPSSEPVPPDSSRYAAFVMHERLISLVAEKLLECALDIQGMTPDLLHPGCSLFARDVHVLFGDRLLPSHALRVLDIAKFMSLESPALGGIGGALCGLSGRHAPLTVFEADEHLFDEAVSMVRAKGFLFLELADVFAVLNRRRDLV